MLEAVKLLAYDVLQQENLTDICYGTVTETEPLKIVLEQKLELTESFLVLSQNVIKHTINYSMRRKDSDENWVQYEMIVEKQLKKGERVIDRVGEEMTENETDTGNTNDNE